MQQAGLALAALAACVALCPSKAILPIASSCCTEVSQHIPRRLLERVNVCRIQRADGDCDLAAIILHLKRRRICVSPHSRTVKQWMKEQAGKRNARGHICHKRKHHSKRSGEAHIVVGTKYPAVELLLRDSPDDPVTHPDQGMSGMSVSLAKAGYKFIM